MTQNDDLDCADPKYVFGDHGQVISFEANQHSLFKPSSLVLVSVHRTSSNWSKNVVILYQTELC